VPRLLGYGYLLRRSAFLSLCGYREWLGSASEETAVCLRLLDAGYRGMYLSEACVAPIVDRAARSPVGFLRNTARNNSLAAVCNMLWPPLPLLPLYLLSYFRYCRAWRVSDLGGAGVPFTARSSRNCRWPWAPAVP
jgi:hypothetical protein